MVVDMGIRFTIGFGCAGQFAAGGSASVAVVFVVFEVFLIPGVFAEGSFVDGTRVDSLMEAIKAVRPK
jgi:hypothetical protein